MKLIGVGGTNGSGKDSLGEYLRDEFGWLFVSVSDLLREEAKRRGLPIEREVLRTISAEWRREFGVGVLVDKAVELFNQDPGNYEGLIAVPMRNPGEAQHIKDLGGTLVWIDADPRLRYERIFSRARSAEDNKTYSQFLAEEKAEANYAGDEATLNTSAVKSKADIFITNDSNDLEAFKAQARKSLRL